MLWQNLLTEGALLAAAGTAVGVVIAVWAASGIRTIDPALLPRAGEVALDLRVLAAAVAASLKEGQRSTRARRGLRSAFLLPWAPPVPGVNHEPTLAHTRLVPCGSFQHSADIDIRHRVGSLAAATQADQRR